MFLQKTVQHCFCSCSRSFSSMPMLHDHCTHLQPPSTSTSTSASTSASTCWRLVLQPHSKHAHTLRGAPPSPHLVAASTLPSTKNGHLLRSQSRACVCACSCHCSCFCSRARSCSCPCSCSHPRFIAPTPWHKCPSNANHIIQLHQHHQHHQQCRRQRRCQRQHQRQRQHQHKQKPS